MRLLNKLWSNALRKMVFLEQISKMVLEIYQFDKKMLSIAVVLSGGKYM